MNLGRHGRRAAVMGSCVFVLPSCVLTVIKDFCSPTQWSFRISCPPEGSDYKHAPAEHLFIKHLDSGRNEAIEAVSKPGVRALVCSPLVVCPKSLPVQSLGQSRFISFGLTTASEKLHPAVGAAPFLRGVENRH